MLPKIKLSGDVDVVALSPLMRGIVLALSYAGTQGGIGLTATGAVNRKFVHWTAIHFNWPGYSFDELYSVNKVLNESDMPPLWVVRDITRHLKLLRRRKDVLVPTKRGQDFLARPEACFDLVATDYLYAYVHHGQNPDDIRDRMQWWDVFLNLINIMTTSGCSLDEMANELFPGEAYPLREEKMSVEDRALRSEFRYSVIRPLCWLGLLYEDREGLTIWQQGTYHKTPLWTACLQLESDTQTLIGVH